MNSEVNEQALEDIRADIQAYVAAGGDINTHAAHYRRLGDTPKFIDLGDVVFDDDDDDDLDLPEFEPTDQEEWNRQFLANYLDNTSQTKLKRSGKHLRQHNLARKRNADHGLVGLDLVSENAHEHGSRALRRKALHDARKGTKPGPFGRGSVKLTDVDLVERHGRASLVALSADRFQKALTQLNADGRRLDLKPKSEFQQTVDALSEVLNRRVSA